eukprot:8944-Heterococcus_DN1.PRE.1
MQQLPLTWVIYVVVEASVISTRYVWGVAPSYVTKGCDGVLQRLALCRCCAPLLGQGLLLLNVALTHAFQTLQGRQQHIALILLMADRALYHEIHSTALCRNSSEVDAHATAGACCGIALLL